MNSPARTQTGEAFDPANGSEHADTTLTLPQALNRLKLLQDAEHKPTPELVAACIAADSNAQNAHRLYVNTGEIFIELQHWQAAEQLAIKALKASPSFGAAFKLLGKALIGIGNKQDAALCHRYGLPQSILTKYFVEVPTSWVSSGTPSDGSIHKRTAFEFQTYELPPPRQIAAREYTEFKSTRLHAAEAYTAVLQNGCVWFDGFNSIIWDRDGRFVGDLCRGYAQAVHSHLKDRAPRQLPGRTCLLENRNATNYYHWMHDVIPKLEVLNASDERLDTIDRFICNPIKTAFQRDTLRRFGIENNRILTYPKQEYSHAEQLLIPVYGNNSLGMRQAAWNPAFYKREYLSEVLTLQTRPEAVHQPWQPAGTRDRQ